MVDVALLCLIAGGYLVNKKNEYSIHSDDHLSVITGYKWDYTFYKWGYNWL